MADGLGLVLAGLAETETLKQLREAGGRVLIHREFQELDAETLRARRQLRRGPGGGTGVAAHLIE